MARSAWFVGFGPFAISRLRKPDIHDANNYEA